ncbi:MAG: choice-of-anchor D domain-containing protein, partial [Bacteroidota bacterium]
QFGTAGEYWLGYIDEVRISNITRDPSTFNLQLPPKNLTVTPSGTSINLNWQNGGGAIPLMRYKIYRGADSTNVSIVDSTASLSFQQSGLGTGLYYYRISAVDSTGFEGAKSYAAGATAVSAPVISLSATTIVFGSVSSGSTTTKSLVVTNTGTATLTGTVSVTANAGFSINKTSISIAAGGKDSVIITFSPTATQSYSATLTITHNAAGSPSTVTLSGTGIGGPSISVSPSSVLVVSNGTFASATVGTVVVTNNGTATLSGTVSYSGSSKLSASPSTLNIAALNSSTITIFISSVSIADGTYSGTITITHNASGSPTAIPIVVRKVSILSTFTASKQFTFESTGSGTNYKLIGIPGITSYSASSIFSGTYKQDWRMYRDNGSTSSNYLVEYDGSSYFSFGLGKGFWVLAKQSKTFSATLSNYISSGAFPISLYSGWNIITNPFELTVLWSDVITYNQSQLGSNAANSIIYSWDNGVWSQATSLVPYSAYYFYNNGNLNTLSIPYDANGALAKQNALAKTSETISPPVSNQHLKISISTGDVETSSVYMAFDEHASNNYDNKDYFAPPASFAVANIQIENIDLSTEQKRLWIEHRTSVGEGQRFHLVVKNTASISSLVVEGLDNFPNDQVYLLDEQRKELYDLKLCQHFDVPTNSEEYRYSVLIGRNKFIDTLNAVIVPNTYSIAQNYPNPFNPTTTIEYTLPQQSHVKMVVYDIMGREVAILVDEFKNAGRYSVIWNATRCASGVYFCRLTMGDYRSIKKLLLLK